MLASSVNPVFENFRKISETKREQGKLFEKFVRQILRVSPQYRDRYVEIWLWNDWPGRGKSQDVGIDLVAKTSDEKYVAIQCKFYESGSSVAKGDVDSFLSAAAGAYFCDDSEIRFARAILFTTAPVSKNALNAIENFAPGGAAPGERAGSIVFLSDLTELGVDSNKFWNGFDEKFFKDDASETDLDASACELQKKELRNYQKEALNAVRNGFKTNDRGKLIMACGAGKTLTSLRIAEELAPSSGRVLYLVPSLSLLAQTLREWTIDAKRSVRPVVVCSDTEIHNQDVRRGDAITSEARKRSSQGNVDAVDKDETIFEAAFLTEPATTRPDVFANRIKRDERASLTVVFSTYQSIQTIIDAQRDFGAPEFDLAICDEAHRTTGISIGKDDESAFTKVHDGLNLKAKKRLYMTATPKIYDVKESKKKIGKALSSQRSAPLFGDVESEGGDSFVLCSMDDETLYGPTFYSIGFKKAVELGILTDYKVAIIAVDEEDARESLERYSFLDRTEIGKNDGADGKGKRKGKGKDSEKELDFDDAAKLLGCWRGLSKRGKYKLADGEERDDFASDPEPVKRAVAYSKNIAISKLLTEYFRELAKETKSRAKEGIDFGDDKLAALELVDLETDHIDGSMGSTKRKEKLDWLKEDARPNVCRVLSNVRCLSEGVDCPSLDAILFMAPRNSRIDAIQSVGRAMRRSPGKKFGYVFIPIVVPSNVEPEEALNANERYRVVWDVLQALRSHDESVYVSINQLALDGKPSKNGKIQLIPTKISKSDGGDEDPKDTASKPTQRFLPGTQDDPDRNQKLVAALCAKIAKKCGDREYLDNWAREAARIAERFLTRLRPAFERPTEHRSTALREFRRRLKTALAREVSEEELLETLQQHFVSKPIFDALFKDVKFTDSNVVAREFQKLVETFSAEFSEEDRRVLAELEREIASYIRQVETKSAKSEILRTFYEKFFQNADKKTAERLGVVYTPTELVDFILRSVDFVVRKEFGKRSGLSSDDVNIVDPFVGTGTFIARLIRGDFIPRIEKLRKKYKKSLFANEIVLLAYYVATANIEAAFEERNDKKRIPFPGAVLTDTFGVDPSQVSGRNAFESQEPNDRESLLLATGSTADEIKELDAERAEEAKKREIALLIAQGVEREEAEREIEEAARADNLERREKERNAAIQIVIGNPPYSIGQKSGNDRNQNQKHERLDKRVAETYAARSTATLKRALYDSYVKAFRWASDRIPDDCGVVAFVTNGAYIDNAAFDGFRKTLLEEFESIYVLNLRGDQRTQGETSRREGGKIFGSGSRAPVAICVLVRNRNRAADGFVRYCDIGDYKTREEKLALVNALRSVESARRPNLDSALPQWIEITPDANGDWINQRDDSFQKMFALGNKKGESDPEGSAPQGTATTFFEPIYSLGLATARDPWVYNFSRSKLSENMLRTIDFYNEQIDQFAARPFAEMKVEDVVEFDPTRIKWTLDLLHSCKTGKRYESEIKDQLRQSVYRPFNREYLFFDRTFNSVYQIPKLFPTPTAENLLICVPGPGEKKDFSALLVDKIPDLHIIGAAQCFPLYYYVPISEAGLLTGSEPTVDGFVLRSAITSAILEEARSICGADIDAEDVFFYLYGALHAKDYVARYASDLRKELPRLPIPGRELFLRFSESGRELANLHLNYDGLENGTRITRRNGEALPSVEPCEEIKIDVRSGRAGLTESELYSVDAMKWAKRLETEEELVERCERQGKDRAAEKPKKIDDKRTLIYNESITLRNVPLAATRYIVNGRSPIDWAIERYRIKTDAESGLTNDPNDWAPENPRYIVDLIRRLATVGIETTKIVDGLPGLLN